MSSSVSSSARTLSRDYKHVRRHAPGAPGQGFSGWAGFGLGLAAGLSVALAVHVYHTNQLAVRLEPVPATTQVPASATATDEATDIATASTVGTPEQVFDFYDMLPKQGVDVANKPLDTATDISAGRLPTGAVVLQAGSFKRATEAEKMVAQLALAGVQSKIQRASVQDETWYRVRIGPIATVEELNVVRAKLNAAEIATTPVAPVSDVSLP